MTKSSTLTRYPLVEFEDAFQDITGGQPKLQQRLYQSTGRFAVVDQGASLIGGFTDDAALVATVQPPAIIFGDHTKAVKWIDGPFVLGADGVKILSPCDRLDKRFAYHFLKTVRLPDDAGYSRHYKFLKRIKVPIPKSLQEQGRIAAILDKADAIRAKRRQALAEIDAMLRSMFLDMFGDLARNPRGFPEKSIAELVDPERPITYGILMPGSDVENGIPYIRVTDIQGGRVLVAQVRRTTSQIAEEYRRSKLKSGDLLLSIRGHVGRMAFTPEELDGANITQDTARLAIKSKDNAIYLRACLESPGFQHLMAQRTKGGAVKGINLGDVKILKIPMAPEKSRKAFAAAWLHLQDMIDRGRQSLLNAEQLFGSLSQRAFRGEL
jgi:type I restriction enzyme, S subunit